MHGFLFAAIMTFGLSGEAFAAPVEKTELRYQGCLAAGGDGLFHSSRFMAVGS